MESLADPQQGIHIAAQVINQSPEAAETTPEEGPGAVSVPEAPVMTPTGTDFSFLSPEEVAVYKELQPHAHVAPLYSSQLLQAIQGVLHIATFSPSLF